MREISITQVSSWYDDHLPGIFRECGPVAYFVFTYLCHGPQSNFTGLMRFSVILAADELDLERIEVERALAALATKGRIEWDPDNNVVFIPGELQRQCGIRPLTANDKRCIGALRRADAFAAFTPLARRLAGTIQGIGHDSTRLHPSMGHGSPSEAPPKPHSRRKGGRTRFEGVQDA